MDLSTFLTVIDEDLDSAVLLVTAILAASFFFSIASALSFFHFFFS